MAVSGSTALDLLVARIEQHTPARDPSIRFSHWWGDDQGERPDRSFEVLPAADLEQSKAYVGDPVTLTLTVDVTYNERTQRFAWLKDAVEDAEDLTRRLVYRNGQEWAKAEEFDFRVARAEITEGRLRLTVEAIYNITV